MDIINIKITNFLAIGDAPLVELHNKGLVLIQGVNEDDTSATSNGVGKSSIADALAWALYGSTARDESGDAVVNNVAKKNCSVRVVLKDGATAYRITRYRKHSEFKNQTIVEASSDDSDWVWVDLSKGTEKETQEVINGIMGCSLDVFMGTIYAGQEVAPDLPKMTDKQLKLLIEEAAGVERLETAYEISRAKMNAAQLALTTCVNTLTTYIAGVASAELEIEREQHAHDAFEAARPAAAAVFVDAAKTHKEAAVALLVKMKGIDTVALTERSEALGIALAGHSEKLKERDKLNAAWNAASRSVASLTRDVELAVKKGEALKAQYQNAEVEVKKACPSCGKPGDEHDLESYRAHVKASLASAVAQIKESKDALADVESVAAARALAFNAFEDALPDVSEMTAEQAEITAKLREHAVLRSNAVTLKAKMDHATEQGERAMTIPNPHSRSVEVLVERLAKQKEKKAEFETKHLELEASFGVFQSVAKIFSPAGVRAHILDTVTPFLNERTSDYLSALSDGNISAVWTTLSATAKGDLREKFCIEVANEKGARSFKGLSGGEKRKVRLATMLALQDLVASRAIKPISLWMGDEIDDALDSAGLERLMGILERKARERGTVLVISHNELRDWVDNVATVTKKGGLSTIEGALCHP